MIYSCLCENTGNWRSIHSDSISLTHHHKFFRYCGKLRGRFWSKDGKAVFFLSRWISSGKVNIHPKDTEVLLLLMCCVWVMELNINVPSALQWLNKAFPPFIHSPAFIFPLQLDPSHPPPTVLELIRKYKIICNTIIHLRQTHTYTVLQTNGAGSVRSVVFYDPSSHWLNAEIICNLNIAAKEEVRKTHTTPMIYNNNLCLILFLFPPGYMSPVFFYPLCVKCLFACKLCKLLGLTERAW